MLVARQGDAHVHEGCVCQCDAVARLEEATLSEIVYVPIHLDSVEPLVDGVVIQWAYGTLNYLVVTI